MLSDRLGIDVWYAVIGGSLGGMQALQWSLDYADRLKNASLSPVHQNYQLKILPLMKLLANRFSLIPDFHNGRYLENDSYPKRG